MSQTPDVVLSRLAMSVAVIVLGLACSLVSPDRGADAVAEFFNNLADHRFEAAADLVRGPDGAPVSSSTRANYIRGWRKAYEGYEIHFTKIALTRMRSLAQEQLDRAGATEGYVYDVKFESTSNLPCVPISPSVLPGTSRPIAVRSASGLWFLLADGIAGFVDTCPGV